MRRSQIAVIGLILCFGTAFAGTNSWKVGPGKWEPPGNWSIGAPSLSDAANLITNAGVRTVTIDQTTTNTPATLTISNLVLDAFPPNTTNTLQLVNAGPLVPLHVLNALKIGSTTNGTLAQLIITNSTLVYDGPGLSVDGRLTLDAGLILAPNSDLIVGDTPNGISNGTVVINNGTANFRHILVARTDPSRGSLNIRGGTVTATNLIEIGRVHV